MTTMIAGWLEHMEDSTGAKEDSIRERFYDTQVKPKFDEPWEPMQPVCSICGEPFDWQIDNNHIDGEAWDFEYANAWRIEAMWVYYDEPAEGADADPGTGIFCDDCLEKILTFIKTIEAKGK